MKVFNLLRRNKNCFTSRSFSVITRTLIIILTKPNPQQITQTKEPQKHQTATFPQVESIGICGQMHGITLWQHSEETAHKDNGAFKLDIDKGRVSNLYTWQDGRCDTEFLASLPKSRSHLPAHTGYGCATLFWFAKNK